MHNGTVGLARPSTVNFEAFGSATNALPRSTLRSIPAWMSSTMSYGATSLWAELKSAAQSANNNPATDPTKARIGWVATKLPGGYIDAFDKFTI
jgi:hypothetical protein